MKMKKLYRDDTLSSRKITHVLSPLPEVADSYVVTSCTFDNDFGKCS